MTYYLIISKWRIVIDFVVSSTIHFCHSSPSLVRHVMTCQHTEPQPDAILMRINQRQQIWDQSEFKIVKKMC